MKTAAKAFSEKTVRLLLEKHGCPVPLHEVRTRFLGNIATPKLSASPMQIIKDLWGGELPVFDSISLARLAFGSHPAGPYPGSSISRVFQKVGLKPRLGPAYNSGVRLLCGSAKVNAA